METEYKGYRIGYLEHNNQFRIDIGESEKDVTSLKAAKEYIDTMEKKAFERFGAWLRDYHHDRYVEITVTSYNERYEEAWVSTKKSKKRTKENLRSIICDTPENRETIGMIHALVEEVKTRNNTIRELQNTLTKLEAAGLKR